MNEPSSANSMRFQRYAIGIIGGVMLIIAMVTFFAVGLTEDNAFFVGVCSKVGLVLLTVFIAWPAFQRPIEKAPAIVNLLLLGLLVAAAVRPRLLLVGLVLAIVGLAIHFGFRFASNKLKR